MNFPPNANFYAPQMAGGGPVEAYSPMYNSINFAQGGLASAAQQLENKGRNGDSVLVHMNPDEVKGLQALAMSQGGSLTINPKTGLPEAFSLGSFLPALLGIGLTAASGGALSPMMAGLIVGGGYGIATGSLSKGLMAGLGAWGGGGIGEGLAAAGSVAEGGSLANLTASQQAAAAQTANQGILSGATAPSSLAATDANLLQTFGGDPYAQSLIQGSGAAAPGTQAAMLQNQMAGFGPEGQQMLTTAAAPGTPAAMQPKTYMENLTQAGQGLKSIVTPGSEGEAARKAFGTKAGFGSMYSAAAPIAGGLGQKPAGVGSAADKYATSHIRPYDLTVANTSGSGEPYSYGSTGEQQMLSYDFSPQPIYKGTDSTTKAADGGLLDLAKGGSWDDEYGRDEYAAGGDVLAKKRRSLSGDPYYKFAQNRKDSSMEASVEQNFAAGGLGVAKAALPPRFLSGGGDGMSDSIKANIDGRQEARLADGEFVVPADVVSHLGNGSSKAGAKKLYGMMDKIRKARTGKKQQAPEVNALRYMPA